jgi:hypothetical protein
MDRLIARLTGSLPPGVVDLLLLSGLDLAALLRFEPLAELFVLARQARGWNVKQAAKIAGVPGRVLREFEGGFCAGPAPWAVPYAVKVGLTALVSEWIAANPVLAADFDWPAPRQLAEVFGTLMHAVPDPALFPAGKRPQPREMLVVPPEFARRFAVAGLKAKLEIVLQGEGAEAWADGAPELLAEVLGAMGLAPGSEPPAPAVADGPATYQFKVALKGIRPLIWRRIAVSSELTLAQLHHVVQAVLGWAGTAPHEFEYRGQFIGRRTAGAPPAEWSEERTRLGELGLKPKAKLRYRYDFDAAWEHEVVLEKILPATAVAGPTCLAGKRAGPPEPCGGVRGYQALCARLAEPQRDEADELRESVGSFAPEAFDLAAVNARLTALGAQWHQQALRAARKPRRRS